MLSGVALNIPYRNASLANTHITEQDNLMVVDRFARVIIEGGSEGNTLEFTS